MNYIFPCTDLNFLKLINHFRVRDAIEILKNDTKRNLTIIQVAYKVGHNNKVTFNKKAFKRESGHTPTEYIKKLSRSDNISTV